MAGASSLPITHILLPHKEVMTEQNAGAIATVTAQTVRLSSSEQSLTVFGRPLQVPAMADIPYQPLPLRHSWIAGQNIGLARAYVHHLKTASPPDLVEVHGRPHCGDDDDEQQDPEEVMAESHGARWMDHTMHARGPGAVGGHLIDEREERAAGGDGDGGDGRAEQQPHQDPFLSVTRLEIACEEHDQ